MKLHLTKKRVCKPRHGNISRNQILVQLGIMKSESSKKNEEALEKQIAMLIKTLEEKDRIIEEKDRLLAEKDKMLELVQKMTKKPTVIMNTINVNVTIQSYGNPSVKHLMNEKFATSLFTSLCSTKPFGFTRSVCMNDRYKDWVPRMIREIHNDPQHPENHNVRILSLKDNGYAKVFCHKRWHTRLANEVIEEVCDKTSDIIIELYTFLDSDDPLMIRSGANREFDKFSDIFETKKNGFLRVRNEIERKVRCALYDVPDK